MQFNDRFILATPSLASVDFNQITDAQLEVLSPPVKEMADMVRQYSMLIRKGMTKI